VVRHLLGSWVWLCVADDFFAIAILGVQASTCLLACRLLVRVCEAGRAAAV